MGLRAAAPARPRGHGKPLGSLPHVLFRPCRTMLPSPAQTSDAARVMAGPNLIGTRGTSRAAARARHSAGPPRRVVPEPGRVESGMS